MIGYLVSVIVAAVPTALALAPMRGSRTRGQVSWRLGFQVNELPFVAAAWLLASTILAISNGTLTTYVGATTPVLAALALAGLTLIAVRGLRAGRAVADALSEGLGAGWRTGLPPDLAHRLRRHLPWLRIVCLPLGVRRRDVLHQRNLAYGPAGRENLLDVYRPRRSATNGACLVYFHGGGYRSGTKNREARALLYRLASQGWLCLSANYRRGRGRRWPDQLIDAQRAIAWALAAAADGGEAAPAVFVAGSSAGAHLAAMAALTSPARAGQADTRLAGAICLYGFYHTPTWIDREPSAPSAPIDLIEANAVPFFIAHARWTHTSRSPARAASQSGCAWSRSSQWYMPNSPATSTPSISTTRCASRRSSTASKHSLRGCGRRIRPAQPTGPAPASAQLPAVPTRDSRMLVDLPGHRPRPGRLPDPATPAHARVIKRYTP
jgi:acetyl esterase/lipase